MASISDLNYLATITAYQAGLSPSKLPQGWVVVATTDSLVRDRVLNPADVKDGYYGVVVRNVETNEYVVEPVNKIV